VELITPHRTINHHETRKGGQGPIWAVAPLIISTKSNEAAVRASFANSQIIAKKSKPCRDGEYVKECIMKAAETLCSEKQQLFKAISLSANTVFLFIEGDQIIHGKEEQKN
jgi:hypothetical protein